ncbi:hypothetical protein EDD18DRAFT_1108860 [Armillaria luteobubalina]|uniref:Uncharacterized protein n=1 Tax=Armillaria luteobubalina TaxID=153913 RepID=A0AA39PYQ0_9AGAR|nr:hypothetical protein EDD18DRAFT_1108860 [Armillaria luteobubalina]
MLDANVVSVDILHTTMIVEWTLKYDTCNNDQSQYNCTEVNIFFDVDLSPSDPRYSNGPYNNSITTDPIIIWNGNFSYRFPTVHTELVISTTGPSYLSAYPFDMYFVNIVAYAQDVSTNTTVLLMLTGPYGLINSDLFTQYLWGNHILHHNILTQQCNEIVVVPIGAVFAFTQLQASMLGAPEGFDFVGLLPYLILLSISLVIYIIGNNHENEFGPSLQPGWQAVKDWLQHVRFQIMTARQIWNTPYNFEIPLMNTSHNSGT